MWFFFLEKFTFCFREMLWRARAVVDIRGKTACRVGSAPMQFSHALMKAGVCPPCSSRAQGAAGILMGMTSNIQLLTGSQEWWELPGVLFAFEKTPRILGCPCCKVENIAVVNYHMDERCLRENEDSSAEKERGCCNCRSNCNNMQSSNQYLR